MREGIIVKAPGGSEPLAVRQQWVMLRFVFTEYEGPSFDSVTREQLPGNLWWSVDDSEVERILDTQRPQLAEWYRKYSSLGVGGCWDFNEDEIHFLEGTEQAWG